MFTCVLIPIFCYIRYRLAERRQEREERAVSQAIAAQTEAEARAAQKKYQKESQKEKRARVLRLVAPVQKVRCLACHLEAHTNVRAHDPVYF
jgi:hypothetical protein